MDLNLYQTFSTVAYCGSLTKASKVLGHPKSKISRDLKKLEDILELTLLRRSPRGVILTESGAELLQKIQLPLEELKISTQHFQSNSDEMDGTIRITAPEDFSSHLIMPLIIQFMETYPDVKIELYSTDILLDFKKHKIDMAIRIGELEDSSLIQKKISDLKIILVASKHYLKTTPVIKTISDLKNHTIAMEKDFYGNSFNKNDLNDFDFKFCSNSLLLLKDFVKLDKGIATIPSFLCKAELSSKEFINVLPDFNYLTVGLSLIYEKTKYQPKYLKKFKDYLFSHLQAAY